MMDEEVILVDKDLSKHRIEQGYSDFDSYNLNEKEDIHCSPLNNDGVNVNNPNINEHLVSLSPENRNILEKILNSKLLFTEDASHIEVLLSFTYCGSSFKNTFCNYVCAIMAAGLPLIMLKKWFCKSLYVPISVTTFYLLNFVYTHYKTADEKFLDLYIKKLQNLCSIAHKVLRFIKETEIITTGQVSSHNICAAIYMKPRNMNTDELNELPSWKTLPQTRKCLAEALVDLIKLFSVMFETTQQNAPVWAKDYIFLSEFHSLEFVNKLNEYCFSIKDLQMLFDTYLVIQSEFLRLIAFSYFPVESESNYINNKFRIHVLKLLRESESKLVYIYSQLKMNYNMECLFKNTEQPLKQLSNNKLKEINTLQLKLHWIYVNLSSLVFKSKGFDDQIEEVTNFTINPNVDDITKTIIIQMSNLKEDLAHLMKSYDEIYNEFAFQSNKKSNSVGSTIETFNEPEKKMQQAENRAFYPKDCELPYNSVDDIFIAVSDQKFHENESYCDDWSPQIKPAIPKSMLKELSTTLIPIKEQFKKREQLALERKGLKDIESYNIVSDENHTEEQNSASTNNRHDCSVRSCICGSIPVPDNVTSNKIDDDCYSFFSSTSLAHLAAKKSQLWNQSSEEHFSDG